MRTSIKRLHQRLGSTIVYVTHDQVEAMTLATHVAVMKGGLIQQYGSPQEIYEKPANMFVAGFIGSPSMNFIPATLVKTDQGQVAISVSDPKADGGKITLPLMDLRPESINCFVTDSTMDPGYSFEGTIDFVEPTGADTMVVLTLGGTEVTSRLPAKEPVTAGSPFRFAVNMDEVSLFDPETTVRI